MAKPPWKTSAIAILCILAALTSICPAAAGERIVFDSRGKAHRIPDINYKPPAKSTGIIPKALSIGKPWLLVSPLAPASYGYGRDMVTWNSAEGKPKGFIVAGARFW